MKVLSRKLILSEANNLTLLITLTYTSVQSLNSYLKWHFDSYWYISYDNFLHTLWR